MNSTLETFGYPNSVIAESTHWAVLLRPKQVTLGALVLAAKAEATAFSALPAQAFSELGRLTAGIETMLRSAFQYDRINYLMLMMVDPHVHFHVLPRYSTPRSFAGQSWVDPAWPGPPDLKQALTLAPEEQADLLGFLRSCWKN